MNKTFSRNLKRLRTARSFTQEQVAERLGVSSQSVSRWECGKILPSVEKLCALSKLLGVHMEELLVLQGQPINIGLYKVVQEPRTKRFLYYAQCLQKVI